MGWPLDPRSWWSDAESTPVAQWLDRWSESTRWWLDPARASPSAQGVLFDLVEGISGRFRGRRVTLDRLRQSVVLTLDDGYCGGTPSGIASTCGRRTSIG